MKKFTALFLSLVMLFTLSVPAFAADTENSSPLKATMEPLSADSKVVASKSAGLAWGPVTVGNVKLYMTNPHTGFVPGLNISCEHINFHADNATTKKPILNYHIVKYKSGNSECLYVYDSVSKQEIIKTCFPNWTSAVGAVVESVKSALKAILSEADWIATATIWAVIIVAMVDLILPMDPIPVLPFVAPMPDQPQRGLYTNSTFLPSAA